jgi:hypothetical protein
MNDYLNELCNKAVSIRNNLLIVEHFQIRRNRVVVYLEKLDISSISCLSIYC